MQIDAERSGFSQERIRRFWRHDHGAGNKQLLLRARALSDILNAARNTARLASARSGQAVAERFVDIEEARSSILLPRTKVGDPESANDWLEKFSTPRA